jgi:hypothetical protein
MIIQYYNITNYYHKYTKEQDLHIFETNYPNNYTGLYSGFLNTILIIFTFITSLGIALYIIFRITHYLFCRHISIRPLTEEEFYY